MTDLRSRRVALIGGAGFIGHNLALALKGASAADEAAEHRSAIAALGGSDPAVRTCGEGLIDPPTTVVEIVRERVVAPKLPAKAGSWGRSRGSGRGRQRRA